MLQHDSSSSWLWVPYCSLFHDVIIVVGIFCHYGWPFDLTVLAAVLAIGYSVNDTIVVYDRIRENFRRVRGLTPRQVLDLSLTETLRRTIMTVGTVLCWWLLPCCS